MTELSAHDMAHGGEAVARLDGKAVFVAGVIPGERVEASITKDGGSWARADLDEILEASPDRVSPPCPHFVDCGGCQWQYLDYHAQLRWKSKTVAAQLAHLGGLGDVAVRDTLPSSRPYAYRNRMDFHVTGGQPALHRSRSHDLVPLGECHLLIPRLADLFSRLGPLDEVQQITLRAGEATGDQMVVIRGAVPKQAEEWDVHVARVRRGRPVAEFGRSHLFEEVAGNRYRITANAFFQNNTEGAAQLVELVREALDPRSEDVVLDGYAGGGLFSVALADSVDEVVAVETSPLGLADLEHNLEAAGAFAAIVPVPFEEAASEVDFWDVAVVDPPRTGLGPAGIETVTSAAPRAIALVSCDPAALARDAKGLTEAGYELDWVAPVDLFPQTYHIETVSRFVKNDLNSL